MKLSKGMEKERSKRKNRLNQSIFDAKITVNETNKQKV